jgi:hypothetical protein
MKDSIREIRWLGCFVPRLGQNGFFWRAIGLGLVLLLLAPTKAAAVGSPADASPALAVGAQVNGGAPTSGRFVPSIYRQFSEWKAACERVPYNRTLKFAVPPKEVIPLKSFGQFAEVLDAFLNLSKTGSLAQSSAWLGSEPLKPQFFNTDAVYFLKPAIPFQPFVQRVMVPAGAQVLFHGDLHGDIHSVVAWVDWLNRNGYLRDFQIIRPDVYFVFLGDYTDRGFYGVEVLYTMLRLKLENPDRVWMVRGNHEDVSLSARYGFIEEGRGKYGKDFDVKHVLRLYDFLPAVLYLGCGTNFVQCNHGGVEPGFDPRGVLDAPEKVQYQLLGPLNQKRFLKTHPSLAAGLGPQARRLMDSTFLDFQPESPTVPSVIGFMWNDFSVVRGEPGFDFDPGRASIYGESTTKYLLNEFSSGRQRIQAVFRAHQHATILNPMMRRLKAGHGIYRHWQETDSLGLANADPSLLSRRLEVSEDRPIPPQSVWTFNVVPDSVYGEACDFWFDTFGILTLKESAADWRLRVVNQTTRK